MSEPCQPESNRASRERVDRPTTLIHVDHAFLCSPEATSRATGISARQLEGSRARLEAKVLNVVFLFSAGDSADNGVMWAYRYKN